MWLPPQGALINCFRGQSRFFGFGFFFYFLPGGFQPVFRVSKNDKNAADGNQKQAPDNFSS
jgi:hypothetical protein